MTTPTEQLRDSRRNASAAARRSPTTGPTAGSGRLRKCVRPPGGPPTRLKSVRHWYAPESAARDGPSREDSKVCSRAFASFNIPWGNVLQTGRHLEIHLEGHCLVARVRPAPSRPLRTQFISASRILSSSIPRVVGDATRRENDFESGRSSVSMVIRPAGAGARTSGRSPGRHGSPDEHARTHDVR